MNWLKKLYSRIFPASKRLMAAQTKLLMQAIKQQNKMISHLQDELQNEVEKLEQMISENNSRVEECREDFISLEKNTLAMARENNWGFVFNNTIQDSEWLTKKSLSLGRWAVGYQCAYVLYRVLNDVKPKHILELGLGQSTKIIGQYANYYDDIHHTVVESDPKWIDFFKLNYSLDENTNILQCDCVMEDFEGHTGIRVFDRLGEKISGEKYDLIVVDAPYGGDMKELSRIDILKSIPQCLRDSFVIIFDDISRRGEINTFKEIQKTLDKHDISYVTKRYLGQNIAGVIASEDLKFVGSL